MSNSLEFSINAKDNTSKVVDTVRNKIKNFGTDITKLALGVAGPMALVQAGISAIGNAVEDYKNRVSEALKFGAEIPNQAKGLNVTAEEYQRLGSAAESAGISIDSVSQAYIEVRKAIDAAKDPTSSQAKALQALGFAAEDIAAGIVKPIEVIERLGRAMATGADDATQFKIASALLGGSVEKLIPILRKAQEVSQGFTDAGDMLSEEEAAILRQFELEKKRGELSEKVEMAKQQARIKFTETKEGEAIIKEMFPALKGEDLIKMGQSPADYDRRRFTPKVVNREDGTQDVTYERKVYLYAEIDAAIKEAARRRKAQQDAAAASKAAADKEAADKLKGIADAEAAKKENAKGDAAKAAAASKAEADKKKETEDKSKKDKDELGKALDAEAKAAEAAGKFTGSSLRDIGGALAGEAMTSGIDYQAAALDISQKILIELQKLNVKTLPEVPDTNFTKPTRVGGTFTA